MAKSLAVRCLAEFIGTFILVVVVTNVTIGGSKIGSLVVASALMIGVYGVGSFSGGHLNPAVSFGVTLMSFTGHTEFSIGEFFAYTATQLLAGASAAFKGALLWHNSVGGASTTIGNSTIVMQGNMSYPMQGHLIGSNQTNVAAPDGGLVSIGLAEMIYTAVLVFVVLNVATCGDEGKEKNSYFGLAIGFVISAAASAIGAISMCCLNPAVALGIALLDTTMADLPWMGYEQSWPILMFFYYTLMELLGAGIACGLFMVARSHLLGAEAREEKYYEVGLMQKIVSEIIGTFVLCLTVMLVVHAPASDVGCVGIAASLMVMIYALGNVSGGNFNPAVSLGLAVAGELPWMNFVIYFASQLTGALFALLTAWLLLRRIDVALVANLPVEATTKFGAATGSWGGIVMAEGIFTFVLVWTVLNAAVRDAPNQYFGLAIGFVVVIGAASVGSISGGCFNPAVALMLDFGGLFGNEFAKFGWGFVYLLVELLAGALAALFFRCLVNNDADEDTYEGMTEGDAEEGE